MQALTVILDLLIDDDPTGVITRIDSRRTKKMPVERLYAAST